MPVGLKENYPQPVKSEVGTKTNTNASNGTTPTRNKIQLSKVENLTHRDPPFFFPFFFSLITMTAATPMCQILFGYSYDLVMQEESNLVAETLALTVKARRSVELVYR